MKTFNFKSLLNLSLMAGLLVSTVLVSSCKSDDDDDERTTGGSAPTVDGKKLSFVKVGSTTTIFEYNNEGKVLTVTSGSHKLTFTYSDTEVTCISSNSSSTSSADKTTFLLTNGRITKRVEDNDVIEYNYDGNGCMNNVKYSYSEANENNKYTSQTTTSFTWKDGNVATTVRDGYSTSSYSSGTYSYTSTSSSKKTTVYTYSQHAFTMPPFEADAEEVLRWQGYFGKNNTNLPSKEQATTVSTRKSSSSSNEETSTNSYTIDYTYGFTGGALDKIIETHTDNNGKTTIETIEFSWN